jgi:hypothetical protein
MYAWIKGKIPETTSRDQRKIGTNAKVKIGMTGAPGLFQNLAPFPSGVSEWSPRERGGLISSLSAPWRRCSI